MGVLARLTETGNMQVSPGIDTRGPAVETDLMQFYPLDGTSKGWSNLNILDYNTWVVGKSGSQFGFNQNGSTDENEIVLGDGPFGDEIPIWECLGNDIESGGDGGWNTDIYPIDPTKLYRYSMWTRRIHNGGGRTYLGLNGYGPTNGVYDHSLGLAATPVTNPYFHTSITPAENVWELWVQYVQPHDNTDYTDHTSRGIYHQGNSTQVSVTGNDFRWLPDTQTAKHRAYLFYSIDPLDHQQFAYPRVDVCDGTEPTIDDLVNQELPEIDAGIHTNTTLTQDGAGVEYDTVNYLSTGIGGLNAKEPSGWVGAVTKGLTDTNQETLIWDSSTAAYVYTVNDVLDDDLVILSEKTVTFSLVLRRLEGPATSRLRIYDDVAVYTYKTIETTDEFQKFTITKTLGVTPGRIFVMLDETGGGTYEFHSCQLETKPYATSYCDPSRGSASLIYPVQPIDTATEGFTCSFDIATNGKTTGGTADRVDFNNFGYMWHLAPTDDVDLRKYVWDFHNTGTRVFNDLNSNTPFETGVKERISISWDGTKMDIYRNGQFWDTTNSTVDCTLGIMDTVDFTNINAVISNFSLHKRAFTKSDAETLGGTFAVKNTGLFTRELLNPINTETDNERFPFITDSGNVNATITPTTEERVSYNTTLYIQDGNLEIPTQLRYVRDYISGSTSNTGNHWNEFKVIDDQGTNLALGLTIDGLTDYPERVTDGVVSSAYSHGYPVITLDLGGLHTIAEVAIWHYYPDGRTYYGTKTEVSADGTTWYTLFDSAIEGTYAESIDGHIMLLQQDSSNLFYDYNLLSVSQDFTLYGWFDPSVLDLSQPLLSRSNPLSDDVNERVIIQKDVNNQLVATFGTDGLAETSLTISDLLIKNNWNIFALRRSGNDVILTLSDGVDFSSTKASTGAFLDTELISHVWKIGNNIDSFDGQMKGFVFAQEYLDDEYLKDVIFKANMKATNKGLRILGDYESGYIV